jgi:hypothetical protein
VNFVLYLCRVYLKTFLTVVTLFYFGCETAVQISEFCIEHKCTETAFLNRRERESRFEVIRADVAQMLILWVLTPYGVMCLFRLPHLPQPSSVTLRAEAARSSETSGQTRYTHGIKPRRLSFELRIAKISGEVVCCNNECSWRCHRCH